MPRTTAAQVQAILGRNWDGTTDVTPYIDSANIFVNNVVACASSKGTPLNAATAEIIERWMSAYYYLTMDPTYKSRSTASASGTWNTDDKQYLKQAISLDPSGCVNGLFNRLSAGGFWAGKTPSQQIPYSERS